MPSIAELLQSTSEPLPKRLKLQPILLASEDSSRSYVVSYKALSEAQPAAQEPEQDDEDIEAQVPQPVQLMSSARKFGQREWSCTAWCSTWHAHTR